MNFSVVTNLDISGHRDIDFVDVHLNTDTPLYLDPERISFSDCSITEDAVDCLEDFFVSLTEAATDRNADALYYLLSHGKEPNEIHLGLSTAHSRGKGTSPEILMPIIFDMLDRGLFEREMVQKVGDLHLLTPNFGYDRLSDLVANIIRQPLYRFTYEQFGIWDIQFPEHGLRQAYVWDIDEHCWRTEYFPDLRCEGYPIVLVPKQFVGPRTLSTPGELLSKYALTRRQQDHLDMQSPLCRVKTDRNGCTYLTKPSKRDIWTFEHGDRSQKEYIFDVGTEHPEMFDAFHLQHQTFDPTTDFMTDEELDAAIYFSPSLAI